MKKKYIDIISAIFIIIAGLFILISLISFDFHDIGFSLYVNNWGGIVGVYVSYLAYWVFGVIAWLLPFYLVFIGYLYIVQHIDLRNVFSPLLLFVVLNILISLVFPNHYIQGFKLEGNIAYFLTRTFSSYIGKAGLVLVVIGILTFMYFIFINDLRKFLKSLFKAHRKPIKPSGNVKKVMLKRTETRPTKGEISNYVPNIEDFIGLLNTSYERVNIDIKEGIEDSIIERLREFHIKGDIVNVIYGPRINRYEFKPAAGIKVDKLLSLKAELAMALGIKEIRITTLPERGTIGIEVKRPEEEIIYIKKIIDSKQFKMSTAPLAIGIGVSISNEPYITDLAKLPHLLIAGSTGSGKSVVLHSLIVSLIVNTSYNTVNLLLIDPKRVEMSLYDRLPHLISPVISDLEKIHTSMDKLIATMHSRYALLASHHVRNIEEYNKKVQIADRMNYIVVVIDEIADIMLSSKIFEEQLTKLAQMSRAVGIHFIIATQRPSVDIITGRIKANFPARISLKVPSKVDSRIILDTEGAQDLLSRGDMLYIEPGFSSPLRLHGAYVSTDEVEKICKKLCSERLREMGKSEEQAQVLCKNRIEIKEYFVHSL